MALSLGLISTGHGNPAFPNRRLISPKALAVNAVVAELREALLEADVYADTCSSTKIVIKSPGRLARSCPSRLSWPAFEKMEPSDVVSIGEPAGI